MSTKYRPNWPACRRGVLSDFTTNLKNWYDLEPDDEQEKIVTRPYSRSKYLLADGTYTQAYDNIQSGHVPPPDFDWEEAKLQTIAKRRETVALRPVEQRQMNHFEGETFDALLEIIGPVVHHRWCPDGVNVDVALTTDNVNYAPIQLKSSSKRADGYFNFGTKKGDYPDSYLIIGIGFVKTPTFLVTQAFMLTNDELPGSTFAPSVNPVRKDTFGEFRYRLDNPNDVERFKVDLVKRVSSMAHHPLEDVIYGYEINQNVSDTNKKEVTGLRTIHQTLPPSVEMLFSGNKNTTVDFSWKLNGFTKNISAKTAVYDNDDKNGNYSGFIFRKKKAPNHKACDFVLVVYLNYGARDTVVGYSLLTARQVYVDDTFDNFCWSKNGFKKDVDYVIPVVTNIHDIVDRVFGLVSRKRLRYASDSSDDGF
jgi:hypothetical protein